MALRAVLFDLGETVLEFPVIDPWSYLHEGVVRVHGWVAERDGAIPELDVYERRARAAIRRAYLWSLLRRREVNVVDVLARLHRRYAVELSRDELMYVVELFYQPLRELAFVKPTTIDVLTGLQAEGLKLGVISNTFVPGEILDDQLAEERILSYFPVRVYSCDVNYMKPDERIFREALARLDVQANEAMFVGDTPGQDVRGANRMGMISVWMRRSQPVDRRYPAWHEIRELTELPPIAERYRKQ
jgi:putative hydrolase of the HAD superfamily